MAGEEGQTTLIEAINAKYSEAVLGGLYKIHISSKAPGLKDSGTRVVPPILALDNNTITSAGPREETASMCGHVTELDLTNNKIISWEQVVQMIEPMQNLKNLNLTSNQLDNHSLPNTTSQFPNLQLLVLNNTGASWDTIDTLLSIFPSLSELHLSLNGFDDIQIRDFKPYPTLTRLHLNKHNVTDWRQLCKLGRVFPNLETFVTIESALQTMLCGDDMSTIFPCLKRLHISKTRLEGWEDVECLRNFPMLCDVRMKSIPFLEEMEEKLRRQLIVARLPAVTCLNGSSVTHTEREDAERSFIRHYMDQQCKPNRYFELEAKYGKLDPLVEVDLTPKVIVKVNVKFDEKEEIMDVDVRQTLKEFKKFLQNFTGMPPGKFRLWHYVYFEGNILDTQQMKYLDRFLYAYKVNEGDEILIEPK